MCLRTQRLPGRLRRAPYAGMRQNVSGVSAATSITGPALGCTRCCAGETRRHATLRHVQHDPAVLPPDGIRRRLLQRALAVLTLVGARVVTAQDAPKLPAAMPLSSPPGPTPAALLLWRAKVLLQALDSASAAPLLPFLREWPPVTPPRSVAPAAVPVLRWLAPARQSAPAFAARLVETLFELAPTLGWHRSYSASMVGANFYQNYGWTEFAGLLGPIPSGRLACGVLLLGPHVTYPPHRHEADEIYVPLSGSAQWRHGRSPWRVRAPGTVIHHSRHESHAMRTDSEPLLALYLWRSRNLAQSSHLDQPLPAE